MPAPWEVDAALSDEQRMNRNIIAKTAEKYGIPESVLLGVLWHESQFKTNPGGRGNNMAQAGPDEAKQYGEYSLSEIQHNPVKAADVAAQYLKSNQKTFNGDWEKAAAAYFVGPGTIQAAETGPGNWLNNADKLAQQYHQGTVTDYLTASGIRGQQSLRQKTKDQILAENGLTPSAPAGANGLGVTDPDKAPDPKDFWRVDAKGARYFDDQSYNQAVETYAKRIQAKGMQQQLDEGPISKYIDDIIQQTSAEISTGKLKLDQADSLLKNRVASYKMAMDAYSSDAFKYAAPSSGQYLPGTEPGGYWNNIGMNPVTADRSITLDPLQQALNAVGDYEKSSAGVTFPSLPNLTNLRNPQPQNPGLLQHAPPIPGANNVDTNSPSTGTDYQSLAEQLLVASRGGR